MFCSLEAEMFVICFKPVVNSITTCVMSLTTYCSVEKLLETEMAWMPIYSQWTNKSIHLGSHARVCLPAQDCIQSGELFKTLQVENQMCSIPYHTVLFEHTVTLHHAERGLFSLLVLLTECHLGLYKGHNPASWQFVWFRIYISIPPFSMICYVTNRIAVAQFYMNWMT